MPGKSHGPGSMGATVHGVAQSQTRLSDFTSLQSEILTDLIHMHRSSLGASITLLLFRCYLCPTLFDPLDCSGVMQWTAGSCQASLSSTISQSLLRLMSIESVMPSNHLILCCPLLPPSVFPSIRVFSNESALRSRVSASVLPVLKNGKLN